MIGFQLALSPTPTRTPACTVCLWCHDGERTAMRRARPEDDTDDIANSEGLYWRNVLHVQYPCAMRTACISVPPYKAQLLMSN